MPDERKVCGKDGFADIKKVHISWASLPHRTLRRLGSKGSGLTQHSAPHKNEQNFRFFGGSTLGGSRTAGKSLIILCAESGGTEELLPAFSSLLAPPSGFPARAIWRPFAEADATDSTWELRAWVRF